MSDLISRQAAIDVIDKILPADPMRNEYTQGITCGAALAMEYVEQLPSAQPEPHYDEWCTDCKEYDQERHCCPRWNRVIRETLKDAQLEIIRCKDCKWYGRTDKRRFYRGMDCLQKRIDTIIPDKDFCSRAERREEDEQDD